MLPFLNKSCQTSEQKTNPVRSACPNLTVLQGTALSKLLKSFYSPDSNRMKSHKKPSLGNVKGTFQAEIPEFKPTTIQL